jgi:hypothetical protein
MVMVSWRGMLAGVVLMGKVMGKVKPLRCTVLGRRPTRMDCCASS